MRDEYEEIVVPISDLVPMLCKSTEHLKDCTTPFDVFCRDLELGGDAGAKKALADFLQGTNPAFKNLERWVDELLPTLREKDEEKFKQISNRAIAASIFQ